LASAGDSWKWRTYARERVGEEVGRHAVVHHLEEAHRLRGRLHLGEYQLGSFGASEVDDRDGEVMRCVVVDDGKKGFGWVVEDGGDGIDARVDEAFNAGLGVVEGLELLEAMVGRHGL
jgi:hypothetical protein